MPVRRCVQDAMSLDHPAMIQRRAPGVFRTIPLFCIYQMRLVSRDCLMHDVDLSTGSFHDKPMRDTGPLDTGPLASPYVGTSLRSSGAIRSCVYLIIIYELQRATQFLVPPPLI